MPTAFVENSDDVFTFADDWKEYVGNEQASGASLSNNGQTATLTGYIPWNKQRSCARAFLGFAYPDAGAPWALHRENPAPHPLWPWLRAATISFQGVGANSNPDNPNLEPYEDSLFSLGGPSRNTRYQVARVTVGFNNSRARYLDDDDIESSDDEWYRNTFIDTVPSVEVLSADGISQLKFAEGGPSGTPFPAPIGVQLNKAIYSVKWLNVPWEYLSADEDIFSPTKIDAVVGHVNSDDFMNDNFLAGTVLMLPYQVEVHTFPVPDMDGNQLRSVDLTLNLSFFDPPKGVGASAYRGHNLMPWRTDGKFYLATRDGMTSGEQLIKPAAFSGIFSHVSS